MPKLSHILVLATDPLETRAALQQARILARQMQARITLMEVVEDRRAELQPIGKLVEPERLWEMLLSERERLLKELAAEGAAADASAGAVETVIGIGKVEIEAIREVLRGKHDLVMLGRTSSSKQDRGVGRIAMHLMRKCPCPVWVVHEEDDLAAGPVLVAVDVMDDEDHRRANLAQHTLEMARMLAQARGSELHVVHAWNLFGEESLRGPFGLPAVQVEAALRESRKQRSKALKSLLAKSGVAEMPHRAHLVKGDAAEVIPRIVRRLRIDLLVMGSVCRTGLAGFLIGNTAERVLQTVRCSVVTFKPEGFISPVQLEKGEEETWPGRRSQVNVEAGQGGLGFRA